MLLMEHCTYRSWPSASNAQIVPVTVASGPLRPFTIAESGDRRQPVHRNDKLVASRLGCAVARFKDRMKKIVFLLFLLAVSVAAGRAQESRQDISISGFGIMEPFIASSTDVQVHSNTGLGVVAGYRFMLTPTSALEANYGITYQNSFHYIVSNTNNIKVTARTQEISGAYVRSFVYRKLNPFVEGGPSALIFLPIRNSGTTSIDVKQQTEIGIMYGGGFAYEISPSFDIRGEYRGIVTQVPNFGQGAGATNMNLTTKRWFNISEPILGVAYHV